ncbi:MAG: 16S rRNA (cytosine(1402)-N(4))-methyltransferase RsmH [Deltaproteobacteria bacterium]|nr:16S rRNA (cytosine(1402)-N(4))-methyltransferase RsmH [Deltaproteobacteria bacterium]
MENASGHRSVLLDEAVSALMPERGGLYVDGTFGAGGHSRELVRRLPEGGRVIALDVDPGAIEAGGGRLGPLAARVTLRRGNFARLPEILDGMGIGAVDGVLLDLGWSGLQLEGKGMSFMRDEPLDMRLDPDLAVTAAGLVNGLPEKALADTLFHLGGETESRRVARAIVAARPVTTTAELARIVEEGKGGRRGARIHPATKTFQALRMRVNDEAGNLRAALENIPGRLAPGGRLAVITFHSAEDRMVKNAFRSLSTPEKDPVTGQIVKEAGWKTLRDIAPSDAETGSNPRARSARLRVLERRAA